MGELTRFIYTDFSSLESLSLVTSIFLSVQEGEFSQGDFMICLKKEGAGVERGENDLSASAISHTPSACIQRVKVLCFGVMCSEPHPMHYQGA